MEIIRTGLYLFVPIFTFVVLLFPITRATKEKSENVFKSAKSIKVNKAKIKVAQKN